MRERSNNVSLLLRMFSKWWICNNWLRCHTTSTNCSQTTHCIAVRMSVCLSVCLSGRRWRVPALRWWVTQLRRKSLLQLRFIRRHAAMINNQPPPPPPQLTTTMTTMMMMTNVREQRPQRRRQQPIKSHYVVALRDQLQTSMIAIVMMIETGDVKLLQPNVAAAHPSHDG